MERVISCVGLVAMLGIAWLMSSHKRRVNWRLVAAGVVLQLLFAGAIISTSFGHLASDGVTLVFAELEEYVEAGSGFMFGIHGRPDDAPMPPGNALIRTFAFGVLPTIVFFSSLMSVLYYFGIMQWIVTILAWVMQRLLGVSGAESLSAAANVFVGHTEAPLVIKPYLQTMTRSELNAVMVGGFATISGGLLAAYVSMGIDAGDLLTASFISAPAALVIAKVMQPEVDTPETMGEVKVEVTYRGANVIEAAAIGATDGMKLALNVAAMLIAFLALIAMADAIIGGIGSLFQQVDSDGEPLWSLSSALGYLFAPIAWLLGIPWQDCLYAGQLLGLKTVANEFVAFEQLGTWVAGNSEVSLSPRTQRIMTYALSGFSNFGAIGIQIGGIGGLAPERRADLAKLGLRAMIGGALACCMTACIAGILTGP